MNNQDRIDQIRQRLQTLTPTHLNIIDESHLHAGHAGARSGGGHFVVEITSDSFRDKSLIKRHRLVYEAIGDMMQREIHALSINAKTPEE